MARARGFEPRGNDCLGPVFPSDTKYFAPSAQSFMINSRVRNLDAMLAQLRALAVTVEPKVAEEFNGKFGWVVDPEGNKIDTEGRLLTAV